MRTFMSAFFILCWQSYTVHILCVALRCGISVSEFLVEQYAHRYMRKIIGEKPERGITMENIITITLAMEKATKNCVKFNEVTENEFIPEKLGSIYVQKSALAEIGFNGGNICISITTDESNAEDGDLKFTAEKTTKNTVKFAEAVANEWIPEKIGSLYVPKFTLAQMGYAGGDIYVSLSVAE